jgi:hypothetical protein
MKSLLSASLFVLFTALPMMVNAADIPTAVEGAESLSKADCLSTTTNDCIQSLCMTSSDIDCPDKCKTSAADKCRALSE